MVLTERLPRLLVLQEVGRDGAESLVPGRRGLDTVFHNKMNRIDRQCVHTPQQGLC